MNKFIVIEKRKHIMLISSWYPNRLDSYNGDFVQRHAMAVSDISKVSVVHVEGDPNINKWELETIHVNEQMTEYLYYFPKSKISLLNFFRKVTGLIKGRNNLNNIDLIHANVVHYHFIWLLFQALPYILTEHATQYHRFHSIKNAWLKKIVYKPIFKGARSVLPVSRHLGRKIEELFGKLPIEVVPNVINIDLFYPNGYKNPVFTFLHLSNLSEAKNIGGILSAILYLKQKNFSFRFIIGGNGDIKQVEDFVEFNKLQNVIQIAPALSHKEVSDYMRSADCFVLFSDFENQPCVLAEAMASGLPFISTDVGGVHEFFPNEGAWLIEKGNVQQLTDIMQSLILNNPTIDKAKLSNYARENFESSYISQKINKIYNDCLRVTTMK